MTRFSEQPDLRTGNLYTFTYQFYREWFSDSAVAVERF